MFSKEFLNFMSKAECLNEITNELGINGNNKNLEHPKNIIRIIFACEDKMTSSAT